MGKKAKKLIELNRELITAKDRLIYIAITMSTAASAGETDKVDRAITNIKAYAKQVSNIAETIKKISEKDYGKATVEERTKFFNNEGWYASDATVLEWISKNGK
jgi:hypothetical protein